MFFWLNMLNEDDTQAMTSEVRPRTEVDAMSSDSLYNLSLSIQDTKFLNSPDDPLPEYRPCSMHRWDVRLICQIAVRTEWKDFPAGKSAHVGSRALTKKPPADSGFA